MIKGQGVVVKKGSRILGTFCTCRSHVNVFR